MEQIKKKLATLKQQLADAEEKCEDAVAEKKVADDKAEAGEQEVSALQRKLKMAEDDLDIAEDGLADTKGQLRESETEREEMRRDLTKANKLVEKLEDEQSEAKFTALKEKLNEADATIDELTMGRKQMEHEISNLTIELESAEQKCEEAKKELAHTLAELTDM